MNDQKNTILAIVLSALVLIGWQIYYAGPQAEKQKQTQQQQAIERSQQPPPSPQSPTTQQQTGAPPAPQTAPQTPGQAASTEAGHRVASSFVEKGFGVRLYFVNEACAAVCHAVEGSVAFPDRKHGPLHGPPFFMSDLSLKTYFYIHE